MMKVMVVVGGLEIPVDGGLADGTEKVDDRQMMSLLATCASLGSNVGRAARMV